MRNSHFFVLGFVLILLFQACTERMICPAYQSAFIHDEGTLERRFSYFNEDSTPKILEASKSKFLIIEPVSYRKKLRNLRTIEMKDIYPIEDDSLEFSDEFGLAEVEIDKSGDLYDSADLIKDIEYRNNRPPADTTPVDTSYVISIVKEKFNIDQELYLWYMREYLVYPDVRLQQQDDLEAARAANPKEVKEKKGFFGFFKNLFKKKDKGENLDQAESDGSEEGVSSPATDTDGLEQEEEGKKGPFGFLKKNKDKKPKEKKVKEKKVKKKKKKKDKSPPQEEEKQEEEDDDDDGEDDF